MRLDRVNRYGHGLRYRLPQARIRQLDTPFYSELTVCGRTVAAGDVLCACVRVHAKKRLNFCENNCLAIGENGHSDSAAHKQVYPHMLTRIDGYVCVHVYTCGRDTRFVQHRDCVYACCMG